jgi:hypothetical protein
VWNAPGEHDPRSPLKAHAERTVADEHERSPAESLEGTGEAEDVLPLAEGAEAEVEGLFDLEPERRSCLGSIARCEALEVDPAVDDLGLPGRRGDAADELVSEPGGDGDDRGGAIDDAAGRGCDAGDAADVRDVLAMGGDDERRASGEGRQESRRDEEMRVDDVGLESAGGERRVASEREVASPSARSAIDDGALDLVSSLDERTLERRDEDPEVGIVGARVHLGDEEDPHVAES